MGNGYLVPGRTQGEERENIFRFRMDPRIRRFIAAAPLLAGLFPSAILSFLTFTGTSWFFPDGISSPIVSFILISATVISIVIAVTALFLCPQDAPNGNATRSER